VPRRGLEGCEQSAQLSRQGCPAGFVEPTEQRPLAVQQVGHGVVHRPAAGSGEPHEHPAPVVRVGMALDEVAALEPVDPVGHGAAGDQGLLDELAGGQLVGVACSAQCREHIELPALEAVLGEGRPTGEVEAPREPGDAGQDFQRRHVEVGALATPRRHDAVDVVGARPSGRARLADPLRGHAGNSTPHQVS
jgi:hypothetical protein